MAIKKSRTRRSAEETRSVMLDAGMAQLEREGVQYGLEHLTLEAAYLATDVPRSSSHAAWAIDDDYSPQTLYQRTVMRRWLEEREGLLFADAAETALLAAFTEHGDSLSRGEIIRVAIQAAIAAAVEPDENGVGSGFLSSDMALKHALASQPVDARDPEVTEWVRRTEVEQRTSRVNDTYRRLAELLSMRPRDEYGDDAFQHLALAIAGLTEGITMRHLVLPEHEYATRSVRKDSSPIPTTLLGVCVEALVDEFFEPIDE
jgi:hypothetical protein